MPPPIRSVDRDRGRVRQAPLPQRHLDVAFLRVVRIEVDRDQDDVLQVRRRLRVIEDLVVEGVVEADAEMRLQRRIARGGCG